MRWNGLFLALAAVALLTGACTIFDPNRDPYTTDRLTVAKDYAEKAPANVIIFPVETEETIDFQGKQLLREFTYSLLMKKGYAPLALTFTDRTLRDLGRHHTPLLLEGAWNIEPFEEVLSTYCDALVFMTIDRYLESGKPGQSGIVIWGRVAIFDAKNMELLYEHYTRQTLHPTDPGGGRELYIRKALQEYIDLLLGSLPPK